MNIQIKFLQFRLWLGLDPGARRAKHKLNQTRKRMRRNTIRAKAIKYQAITDPDIIARPVMNEDIGETVLQLTAQNSDTEERSLSAITADGIAVYDPTDSETIELMRRFEFGEVETRDREAIFGNQVDTEAPPVIEWEAPDPFAGVRILR